MKQIGSIGNKLIGISGQTVAERYPYNRFPLFCNSGDCRIGMGTGSFGGV